VFLGLPADDTGNWDLSVVISADDSMLLHVGVKVFIGYERLFASSTETSSQDFTVRQLVLCEDCRQK